VNSALQRARATIDARPGVEANTELETIATRYIDAWQAGNIDALVALLHADVIVSMPPVPTWFRGADAARAFFGPKMGVPRRMLRVAGADTLMFASYRGMQAPYEGYAIQVLHVAGGLITEMHAFVDSKLLPKFDVPLQLDR
jgi:RNA polymerase sigma-70 factor (ECF subfamily)